MGFWVLVTVSSMGSCDSARLISFLLLLCAAVDHGRWSPLHSQQATLRIHSSTPFHSRYADPTTVSSGVFYNQKKMVFLPVYRRVLLLSLGFMRRPQCPTSFFPPKLSKVNSVKEKHHLTKSAFIFFSSGKVLLLLKRIFLAIAIWKLGQVCRRLQLSVTPQLESAKSLLDSLSFFTWPHDWQPSASILLSCNTTYLTFPLELKLLQEDHF